jgi:hypothetical protein
MDAPKSSVRSAAYEGGVQDHPHACMNGYVYLGYTAIDEETVMRSSGQRLCRAAVVPRTRHYLGGG